MKNRIWNLLTPSILLALLLAALPTAAGPATAVIVPQNLDPVPIWASDEADETAGVAWGDWDNDGDLDLAVANYSAPDRVYENLGGALSLAWSSAEEDPSTTLAWGDWDNDGDLDLAVGGYGVNHVYSNTGGALSLAWSSAESEVTFDVAWGDWDKDGDLDLAVGNYNAPNRLYENTGGSLTLAWSSSEEDLTYSLAWGDWDKDGDLDLAVANYSAPDRVYENLGGALSLAWSSAEEDPSMTLAWGDWDNDGDLDLAVGGYGVNHVYSNTGGALSPAWSSAESETTFDVAWGDWDNDGDLDLAVGNYNAPNRVYENTGGSLTPAWSTARLEKSTSVAWGDWNGDGDLDLAVGNATDPNLVYENLAGAMPPAASWSSPLSDQATGAAWGDWDGDGDLDLAVATNGQPTRIYENGGGSLALVWSSVEEDYSYDLAWGDWDGDGDLDLAVANGGPNGSPNRVYENTGGDLTLAWSSTEKDNTYAVAWGDMDGDGDLDLAIGNWGEPNRVYENTGGALSLSWSCSEGDDLTSDVAWGDWDKDGDLDLAVGNYSDQPNRVYQNDGGTLHLAWTSTETDTTNSVAWGDWNGDGALDLAVGNWQQPNRVYPNSPAGGNLMPPWSTAEADRTASVAWGDWDGDGDLDLAVGNNTWNNQNNRVYENLGSALDPVAIWGSEEGGNTLAVAWGDWDNDGDLDLLAANWGQPLRLYENNRVAPPTLPNNAAHPVVYRPGSSADAFFYSSAEILTAAKVPIFFRLYDAESDPVARIAARYSTDGGGAWHVATITGTVTNLSTSPTGQLHTITWDALADGARGDNVIFRLISVLDKPAAAGFPIQRPFISADTAPFRLRPLAVALLPRRQLGIGPAGAVLTHTLTLVNRTGHRGLFALNYDSFRGWPVSGPALVGPVDDLGVASFTVTTTVPAGPAGVLDVVTATAAALFNPATFNNKSYILTYRGAPDVLLTILKDSPFTVAAAEVMTYTLVVHNGGSSPASGIVITDTLPAEVTFAWASNEGVYSPTLGAVLWSEDILLAGRALTVTVAVTVGCVPSGTLIINGDYFVDSSQTPAPIIGPATAATVLYDAPVAAFSPAPNPAHVGEPVVMTNDSLHANSFLWEFGDGFTSTLAAPEHIYTYEGVYTVTLTAANACGSDQASAPLTATLFLQAGFESNAPVCLGEAVVFTNTTAGLPPITYTWDLGDGTISTLENPTHTYAVAGFYLVSLRAHNPYGEGLAADMVDVLPPPTAGFTYTANWLTVSFINTSTAADSYLWTFGDGSTSAEEYPVHTYANPGSYTVTLTANGVCGSNQATATVTVRAEGAYKVFLPLVRKNF